MNMSCNPHKGEIEATLGGRRYTLRLTLGALAELEAALNADSLPELLGRFEQGRFSARDLIALIHAGLRGAGHDISREQVARFAHEQGVQGFVEVSARLLAAAFPPPEEEQ